MNFGIFLPEHFIEENFIVSIRRSAIALCAAVATSLTLVAPANAAVVANPVIDTAPGAEISLKPLSSHETGQFDESAAEIVTYHAATQQLLVVNALSGNIDILDLSDPANPNKIAEITSGVGNGINSVAVREDGLAVANVQPADKTDEGSMLFFDANTGTELGRVTLGGSLPDMVGISADGAYAFSANEGEPAEDYSRDPDGSVSIVALPPLGDVQAPAQSAVRVADFRAWNKGGTRTLHEDVRIFGQVGDSTTIAQNLEPEYITEIDGKAYVTLQENNAIAVVDLAGATVEEIFPLGFNDLSTEFGIDASDRDGEDKNPAINIRNWPIKSIPLPDAIEAFRTNGQNYLVMANEGDARDWEAYAEEARVKDLGDEDEGLPPICEDFDTGSELSIEQLQEDGNLGRLNITTSMGLSEDGSCYTELYTFGGRGFSIFDTDGNKVFNSGQQFEDKLAQLHNEGKLIFNASHDEAWFDSRSDNKGPEPEGVALGEINGKTYAFIGLERVGGVFVYDVSNPATAEYVTYVNNRDFSVSAIDQATEELNANWAQGGDLGPEGLAFIPAADSPNGKNLLAVGNEVSGTTTVFEIDTLTTDPQPARGSSAGALVGLVGLAALMGGALAHFTGVIPQLQAEIQKMFTR